ncbi:MAG: NAD-dependent malic enzyme [Gammaproteobacteria bacterium]|nr:NAD-dependent malic enzyme [Gammaproteobacteria bacterium]
MRYKKLIDPQTQQPYLEVDLCDTQLLRNPLLNKGMAFTRKERETFNLLALLPPAESSLHEQCLRSYETFRNKTNDLQRYVYLRDLQDSNETLFYALLSSHIEEMLPIVYTPTVGEGCQQFSHIYRHPRGLYLAYPYADQLDAILASPRFDLVKAIVVSDGERILGLGDQGAGGMGIPIGKLSLYTACAGLHPAETLPILLDTGTNNSVLLSDPLYIGWRHERIRGEEYDTFIDRFVTAIKKRFPQVLLQWEDFAKQNANRILDRYKNELCTFNDDVQGTAAVAAGTLLSALHLTRVPLGDQRIVIFGAGSAGCGIASLLVSIMVESGVEKKKAYESIYLIDSKGLLVEGATHILPFQAPFLQAKQKVAHWKRSHLNSLGLLDVVTHVKPTVLLGVSGQGQAFTEEIVKTMAAGVERPIIFPLSNPTDKSEATPHDLLAWTNDKAIVSAGSPFANVLRKGQSMRVDQTNNCYIFPGMGLGIVACAATRVTEKMFMLAAQVLAAHSPARLDPEANLLPSLPQVREVSRHVAIAVAKEAITQGLSPLSNTDNIEALIDQHIWTPEYWPYKKPLRSN